MNNVFVFYDQQGLEVPCVVEPVLYCSPRTSFLSGLVFPGSVTSEWQNVAQIEFYLEKKYIVSF